MKIIIVYSDPGHAWAKVKRSELSKLNLLSEISSYSYQKNEHVYLEEDSDLRKYIKAIEGLNISYKFKEFNSDRKSKIRSYNFFALSSEEKNNQAKLIASRIERYNSINQSDYKLIQYVLENFKG